MAGGINVEYGPERTRELDRIAAKLSISRSNLLRKTVDKLIAADKAGREPFADDGSDEPRYDPDELRHAIRELREQRVESDRQNRAAQKRELELRAKIAAYEADVDAARRSAVNHATRELAKAMDPLRAEMADDREKIAGLIDEQPRLDAIDGKLAEHTAALTANTAAIERLCKEPRTQNFYDFGFGRWSRSKLAFVGVTNLAVCTSVSLLLADVLPARWLETPTANWMLDGGGDAVCRLLDHQYGAGSTVCRTKFAGDKVTVTATLSQGGR